MFRRNEPRTNEFFVPEQDVTEVGADGVERLVAAKGVPVPMADAEARGLTKPQQKAAPAETKADEAEQPAPSKGKAKAAPAEPAE